MGVASFYRWLVNKYPKIVAKAVEGKGDGDTSLPNPNKIEFDHLYLDMNGIIHPCFHPDHDNVTHDFSLPLTFDDVFNSIYEYIDHIFSIVRPRKLLYMAIDGVAPRAKMNQQRSRRFRNAKDNEIAELEEERLRKEFEMKGKQVLPKQDSQVSDSNVITPGTVFMFELSRKLQSYIKSRMNTDPGWKDIKVILSDSNVPGEGEQKIMSFIRQQRTVQHYNSNTRHCIYGLDADLIMLALSTHEIHFSILREDVLAKEQQLICPSTSLTCISSKEASPLKSRGWFKDARKEALFKDDRTITKRRKPYEFLHMWILREYLELDLKISDPPQNFTFDVDRMVDDFTFMCFFVGNDFLPHMPSLEIHEGALDLLMAVYKDHFKNLGGYLLDMQRVDDPKHGFIKLKRVEKFILLVGTFEERIFKKRSELRDQKLRRLCEYPQDEQGNEGGNSDMRINTCSSFDGEPLSSRDVMVENTKELKEKLKTCLRHKADLFKNGALSDQVKLGTIDWRRRYYKVKFSAEGPDMESTRKEIVQKYTEGLLWVLLYYYSGVPSWTWFYPYHYGPFCSDLKGLARVKVKFQKGSPFKPFDQLMAVLPPRSAHALPKAYQVLMTDENSSIIDSYPTDFQIDTDGKRFLWQGICKLNFINEERLLAETRRAEEEAKHDEAERNTTNADKLFVRRANVSESQISSLVSNLVSGRTQELISIDSSGMAGSICLCPEEISCSDSTFYKILNNIQGREILCVRFKLPEGGLRIPHPLEGVEFPPKIITEADIEEVQLWHECVGSKDMRSGIQNKHGKSFDPRELASSKWTSSHNSELASDMEPIQKGAGTRWWGAGTGRGRGRGRGCPTQEVGGFGNLKISEPSQGSMSTVNFQSAGDNSWQSRNATAYNNTSNAWRQRSEFGANASIQNGGGGQWATCYNRNTAWQLNTESAANPSRLAARGTGSCDDSVSSSSYTNWKIPKDREQNQFKFTGYHSPR